MVKLQPPPDQPRVTAEGIVVPLGLEYPGESITFSRQWKFGDIDQIGRTVPGTGMAMDVVLPLIKNWLIKDDAGNLIVFDGPAMIKDHTLLYGLTAGRARQITLLAFTAYNESAKPDPLAS
jgi:hypothetical protein